MSHTTLANDLTTKPKTVGVLALQGDFREHRLILENLGAEVREVRKPEHLLGLAGLVLPGGESTTIARLARSYGLDQAIVAATEQGLALLATCAGLIWASRSIVGYPEQPRLGILDLAIRRNAFGRQKESFEEDLEFSGIGKIRAAFIRAPRIAETGPGVEILASYQGEPVAIRQGRHLGLTFHPEITGETGVHRLFLEGLD